MRLPANCLRSGLSDVEFRYLRSSQAAREARQCRKSSVACFVPKVSHGFGIGIGTKGRTRAKKDAAMERSRQRRENFSASKRMACINRAEVRGRPAASRPDCRPTKRYLRYGLVMTAPANGSSADRHELKVIQPAPYLVYPALPCNLCCPGPRRTAT